MSWYDTLFRFQMIANLVIFFVAIVSAFGYLIACGEEEEPLQASVSTESVELMPVAGA
jgi:hypothetical protein